ncbi:MAG: carboxypeptidase-like regulatory domain-containing protein [Candidatus ainarchaeum sp.]|nr:carboxypeptidase-like regulatory domain-containing protein [Candidatus ainarchaeum sp.]
MGVKDLYFKIEDKYYGFLDWLDKRGLNLYPVVDAVESRGMPSFPVFILIIILIIIGLWFLIGFMLVPAQANVSFLVTDETDSSPLEGAQITVTAAGEEKNYFTESNGEKQISLQIGQADITVEKTGYETRARSISIGQNMEKQVFSLSRAAQFLSRTIQIMNDRTSQLLLQEITLDLGCSNSEANYSETKTTNNGKLEVQIPENCGRLIAKPASGFTSTQNSLDITDASVQLFLDPVVTEKGTINAAIKSSDGSAIVGATARLLKGSGVEERVDYSSNSGSVSFTNVPTGTYYLVVHAPGFEDYDGKNETKELLADQSITFTVEMGTVSTGTIKILVKDASAKSPVKNAVARLKKDGTTLDTQYTDDAGNAEFDAAVGVAYGLEIDHPNYMLAAVNNVTAKETVNEIFLEASTPGNSNTVYVTVVDARENPVENVKLVLKKDGKQFGAQKTTGSDGKAEFANLPLAAYSVYAEKKGFQPKESEQITLVARQKNELKIALGIGYGKIKIITRDSDGTPLENATVTAKNILDEKIEFEDVTNSEGIVEFELRADKTIYATAEAEGYLPYHTIKIAPDPDSTVEKEIFMVKDVSRLEVDFRLVAGSETVSGSVTEGMQYTARLLLKIPKKTSYGQAGIHFRTGAVETGKTRSMQQDNAYIKEVRASARDIVRGTTYTPDLGYGQDSANLTAGDAKWANVTWKNVSAGIYEMEADVQVKGTANLGDVVELWYRGFGKSASYARFPADKELGNAESTANKQALYANANLARFTVGPSNLCGTFFCKSYTIEDLSTNIKTSVVDRYPAKIGNLYKLAFTISNNSDQLFTASVLKIANATEGIRFLDYTVRDAFGLESKGTVNGYELQKEIGDMQKNSAVFGAITFIAEKDGANPVDISIVSDTGSAFSESIIVDVEPAKEMQITLLPKTIVPLIDNELLIKVTDGNKPVSEAAVTIYLNDASVFSGKTNAKGEMGYKLQSPNSGSVLKIAASKPGYKNAEISVQVTNEILMVTPPEIVETLNSTAFEKEIGIRVKNATQIPLKISSLSADIMPNDLIEFSWPEDLIAKEIPVNGDLNFFIKARLTEKGLLLEKTATPKGSLAIEVKNESLGRTFVKNIPTEIRIALNGAADDAKCLAIDPGKWEIVTGTETKTMELTLLNSCMVSGNSISLKNLQAKIDWKDSEEIGSFEIIDSSNAGLAQGEIGKTFSTLLPVFDPDNGTTIILEFTPNEGTAEAEPVIVFQAVNPTEKKIETISAKLATTISINELSECIKVSPDGLTLYPASFNTGYDQYSSFGYNPTANNGFGTDAYSGYSSPTVPGTTSGYLEAAAGSKINLAGKTAMLESGGYIGSNSLPQNSYPYSQSDIPFQSRYYDNASAASMSYALGVDSIKIENTCTTAVDITLAADAGLTAAKDKLTLDPETSESVKIESGYQLGLFNVAVNAKIKGSKDKAVKIKDVAAEVLRPEEISDDCIDLQPKRISLNSFYGEPQPGRIYNYCYHLGVNLEKTDRVVEFACRVTGQPGMSGMGMYSNIAKPGTLNFSNPVYGNTLPITTGTPYDPTTGAYTGGYGSSAYSPLTTTGYLNSGYGAPQAYTPTSSMYNYTGTPFTSPNYSMNETYLPQGASAPYGQGYYNTINQGTGYGNYGNGYYYPGVNSSYGGTSSGYLGGGGYTGAYPYGSNGQNYAMQGGFEGACPVIDSVYIMGEKKMPQGNGMTQVLEYEVTPNMQYRQQLCPYGSQLPYENLMGLRMAMMGSYYRSNINSTAQVNYSTPVGAQTAFFRVELEDAWGAGEGLDACLLNAMRMIPFQQAMQGAPFAGALPPAVGNPQAAPEKCININALDEQAVWLKAASSLKGFVPQDSIYWQDGKAHAFIPQYPNGAMILNLAACGATDKIELKETAKKKAGDIELGFEIVEDGHNIKMTTDRSALKTKCAKAETTIKIVLKRPAAYSGAKEFDLKAKVWVLHPSVTAAELADSKFFDTCEKAPATGTGPDTGTAAFDTCEKMNGTTSEKAFKEYGFDRLIWKWNWADIGEYACDETASLKTGYSAGTGGMFCDATQFAVELNKKGKKITDYAGLIKDEKVVDKDGTAATTAPSTQPSGEASGLEVVLKDSKALDNAKNSLEIFRWALKQAEITDYAIEDEMGASANESFKEVMFYNKAGDSFLSLKFSETEQDSAIKSALGAEDYAKVKAALKAIQDETAKTASDAKVLNAELKKIKDALVTVNGANTKLKHPVYIVLEIDSAKLGDDEKKTAELFGMRTLGTGKGYMTIADYLALQTAIADAAENGCKKPDGTAAKSLQEAAKCTVTPLFPRPSRTGPVAQLAVETSFLDKLAENSGFLLVPAHTQEMNIESQKGLVEYVMKNGKMVQTPAGYEAKTLLDFYRDNISFNSYLIKDNYSKIFREQFAGIYRDIADKGIADFAQAAISGQPLAESGKYSVSAGYYWGKNPNWAIGLDKKVNNLSGLQAELEAPSLANNIFLKMPFDAKISAVANRDYGVKFSNLDEKLLIAPIEGTDFLKPAPAAGGTVKAATLENYKDTKGGQILKVTDTELTFTPSKGTLLSMKLNGAGGKTTVLYRLAKSGNLDSYEDAPFKWVAAGTTASSATDRKITSNEVSGICTSVSQDWFGLPPAKYGSSDFKAIMFLPTATGSPAYDLVGRCANSSATITATGAIPAAISMDSKTTAPQSARFEAQKATDYTVYSYLEKIKSSEVCVIAKDAGIELKWNSAKIAGQK